MEKKEVLPGGTTRSEQRPEYRLVPSAGPRRIALRFQLGAKIHGEGNWMAALSTEAGAAAFARSAFNHMQDHALRMANGENPEDDHLDAIGWAVCTLAYVEELYGKRWTELNPEAPPRRTR